MCAVTQPSSASLPREMEGTSVDAEERHIPGALDGIRPKTHQVLIDGMDSIESTSSRLLLQLVVIHYLYQSKQPSTEQRQKWLSIRRSVAPPPPLRGPQEIRGTTAATEQVRPPIQKKKREATIRQSLISP